MAGAKRTLSVIAGMIAAAIGLFVVALVAVIVGATFIDRLAKAPRTAPCPNCGERIPSGAPACRHCNAEIEWKLPTAA